MTAGLFRVILKVNIMHIHIKNMVCPRCIMAVRAIFAQMGLTPRSVTLGTVEIDGEPDEAKKSELAEALAQMGFELLDDQRTQLVEQLRVAVIEWVRMKGERPRMSDFICSRIPKDYSALSKLFSEVRGITLERFAILHRIEYAKELLCYNQLTTSEIAYRLGYSSPAHFSAQFKQITGMTPKTMRQQSPQVRIPLNEV